MRPCDTLIVCALLPEAKAVARACGLDAGRGAFKQNLLYTPKIAVALVGPRATKLSRVAANVAPKRVIMAGLAGGLSPRLKIGDVVFQSPKNAIYTSDEIVCTAAQKAALFIATGCVAVDMETRQVQEYAARIKVPFAAIRAISDAATDELDPQLLSLVDVDGNPRIKAALVMMFLDPEKIMVLLRLNRATKKALTNLGAAIRAWLGGTGLKPKRPQEEAAKSRDPELEAIRSLEE